MPLSLAAPRRHIKSYHYHHHLLVQFILTELISTHLEIESIKKILPTTSNDLHKECLDNLITGITKLSGSTQGYLRLFSWNDDGTLAKLKNYCAFFCHNGNKDNTLQIDIHKEANQAWLLSLQALDIARIVSQQLHNHDQNQDIEHFFNLMKKMFKSIQRLTKFVGEVLLQFRYNENVVFFILRHTEDLDKMYNTAFTLKLFKKMHPKRSLGVRNFLTKKFQERGFSSLIPIIENKLTALQL